MIITVYNWGFRGIIKMCWHYGVHDSKQLMLALVHDGS